MRICTRTLLHGSTETRVYYKYMSGDRLVGATLVLSAVYRSNKRNITHASMTCALCSFTRIESRYIILVAIFLNRRITIRDVERDWKGFITRSSLYVLRYPFLFVPWGCQSSLTNSDHDDSRSFRKIVRTLVINERGGFAIESLNKLRNIKHFWFYNGVFLRME